jgi:hypothetical protein
MGIALFHANQGLPAPTTDIQDGALALFGQDIGQSGLLENMGMQPESTTRDQVIVCPGLETRISLRYFTDVHL